MRPLLLFVICSFMINACSPKQETSQSKKEATEAVNAVMDDWHAAAAEGDFNRYFNYFEDDSSIYMGTDATERWTVGEFKPWAKPFFKDDGVAWSFTSTFRKVYFSENGKTAWFDEQLDTPNLGQSRGSGVLVKHDGKWKIAHYNLAVQVPNAIADDVVKQINNELEKESEE